MAVGNTLQPDQVKPALQAWFEQRMPSARDVSVGDVAIPKSTGMSNETVVFTASWRQHGVEERRRFAARVEPSGGGLFPDYDLARERRVMQALAEHSPLPVAHVHALEPDPGVLGRPFLVMDFVDGRVVADDPPYPLEGWVATLRPGERRALHDNLLQRLAQLHRLDVHELGLADLPRLDDGETAAARQVAYVERFAAFAATGGRADPTLAAALQWLAEHCPEEQETEVLCWGDARLANAMFAGDGSVTAMLDWEEATLAAPAMDVGYWLYSMRYYSEGLGIPLLPGFPTADETVARYEELSGRPLAHREFYEVLAAARACCIGVRLMNLMVQAGLLPADSELLVNNPSTQLLARMLELPAPGGRPQEWAGLR